jgi:hypothetical protein
MQTGFVKKSDWQVVVAGASAILTVIALLFTATYGCAQGREGDRCNPDNALPPSEDECGSGLECQIPVDCPEAYCCPPDGGASMNAFCQKGCNGGQASICDAGGMADCPP